MKKNNNKKGKENQQKFFKRALIGFVFVLIYSLFLHQVQTNYLQTSLINNQFIEEGSESGILPIIMIGLYLVAMFFTWLWKRKEGRFE